MIKFFAEGLPRLGVVNIQIRLDTPSKESTKLSTKENDRNAILHHDGTTHPISLPSPSSSTKDITPLLNQTTITCRVSTFSSLVDEAPAFLLSADDINLKWSRGADLSCAKCHRIIVQNQPLRWKDLPSDSWEEYSDYWHCHPGSPHSHSHSQNHADNHSLTQPAKQFVLRASPGTSLVGLTYLLTYPTNTQNINFEVPLFPSADSKKAYF
jgi:HECT-like Ubiquitin-conjugating enzyme (E2)-binding